ncbi:hypothetical protein SAMN05444008_11713 [Cnuella takakiae]|uniref:Uncharacterized protein n=1 Tax=Cnuella takakiae TaxID=1302690 RepID=A0A1M5GPV6_9BACT|nr:hypothetical protein [Cnuella takakiae]OLY90930.1 hypothetical protein BUE76_02715 [Cnuella takakiae]SHG05840.1 hypothetical protein SAMN05444008_11713 [Cnuella takakiae]
MNNLLDFAGLLLYVAVLPILIPMQALLYALGGIYLALVFFHRMVLHVPQLFGWLRHASRHTHGPIQVLAWRKKLAKVHA